MGILKKLIDIAYAVITFPIVFILDVLIEIHPDNPRNKKND